MQSDASKMMICLYIYVYIYAYMYACTYYICIDTYAYDIYTYMYICIYIYIHSYVYAYVYTNIFTGGERRIKDDVYASDEEQWWGKFHVAGAARRALVILGEQNILSRAQRLPCAPSRGMRVLSIDGGGVKGVCECVCVHKCVCVYL